MQTSPGDSGGTDKSDQESAAAAHSCAAVSESILTLKNSHKRNWPLNTSANNTQSVTVKAKADDITNTCSLDSDINGGNFVGAKHLTGKRASKRNAVF